MLLVFNGQQFWEHSSTRPPAGRVMLQGPVAALISSESDPRRTPGKSPAFGMAGSVPARTDECVGQPSERGASKNVSTTSRTHRRARQAEEMRGAGQPVSTGDYWRFMQKEDWSNPAGYVASFVEKDDLILFNATKLQIPSDYYFKALESSMVSR
jgi:hypothetical protein